MTRDPDKAVKKSDTTKLAFHEIRYDKVGILAPMFADGRI